MGTATWFYYNTEFQSDQYNPWIKSQSAWLGHRRFAYDLTRFLQPKVIVELGTHYGASFFSFCQGVKDGKFNAQCYAIDTWKGDPQSGTYGEEVYDSVRALTDMEYPGIGFLLRTIFDEASDLFRNGSIDILHIDGFHSYEAVSHDFITWLPKMSENGVILFHDIKVDNPGFGVHLLWNDLKKQYPTFEFNHSYGLGVLFPKISTQAIEYILSHHVELRQHYELEVLGKSVLLPPLGSVSEKRPKVSILIPTYNRPQYFEAALQSAIDQTYKNIEILIGDDSTNDDTANLIEKYVSRYSFIKYFRNSPSVGQSMNDLRLFNLSSGEYINYLMDDDLFRPNKIERMMEYFLTYGKEVTLVTSHRQAIDAHSNLMPPDGFTARLFEEDTLLNGKVMARLAILDNFNYIGEPTTVLFRKSDLHRPFGVFHNREYGCNVDLATWYSLLQHGRGIYIAETLSYWRVHEGQQTHSLSMLIKGATDYAHSIIVAPSSKFVDSTSSEYMNAVEKCLHYLRSVLDVIVQAKTEELAGFEQNLKELREFTLILLELRKKHLTIS